MYKTYMAQDKKRQSQLDNAANVLHKLLQSGDSPLADQFIRWRLWNSWETVVGQEVAKHTTPVSYLQGTLYIWVENASRMQELTFLVRPLRDKINKHVGRPYVKFIRFTLDRKSVPQPQDPESETMRDYISRDGKNEPSSEL